jgi:chromosome segregation ATPase
MKTTSRFDMNRRQELHFEAVEKMRKEKREKLNAVKTSLGKIRLGFVDWMRTTSRFDMNRRQELHFEAIEKMRKEKREKLNAVKTSLGKIRLKLNSAIADRDDLMETIESLQRRVSEVTLEMKSLEEDIELLRSGGFESLERR